MVLELTIKGSVSIMHREVSKAMGASRTLDNTWAGRMLDMITVFLDMGSGAPMFGENEALVHKEQQ